MFINDAVSDICRLHVPGTTPLGGGDGHLFYYYILSAFYIPGTVLSVSLLGETKLRFRRIQVTGKKWQKWALDPVVTQNAKPILFFAVLLPLCNTPPSQCTQVSHIPHLHISIVIFFLIL